jgi:hypothetical protein
MASDGGSDPAEDESKLQRVSSEEQVQYRYHDVCPGSPCVFD